MGALPTLFAATQDLPGDTYVGPDSLGEQRGHPKVVGRSGAARDAETARAAVGALRGAHRRRLPAEPRRSRSPYARGISRGAGRLHESCPTSSQCCGSRWNTQSSARWRSRTRPGRATSAQGLRHAMAWAVRWTGMTCGPPAAPPCATTAASRTVAAVRGARRRPRSRAREGALTAGGSAAPEHGHDAGASAPAATELLARSTAIAALRPGTPLTPPPRRAPAPQMSTRGSSVSTPQVPTSASVSANGQVRSRWKMLPPGRPSSASRSSGLRASTHGRPSASRHTQSRTGSASTLSSDASVAAQRALARAVGVGR